MKKLLLVFLILVAYINCNSQEPIISVEPEIYGFDQYLTNFKVFVYPDIENENSISGIVYGLDTDGKQYEVTKLSFDKNSDATNSNLLQLIATSDRILKPNNYIVKLIYNSNDKNVEVESKLKIFQAIDDEKNRNLEYIITASVVYGEQFYFYFSPSSEGYIPANQFKFYFNTDNDSEKIQLIGLQANRTHDLFFPATAKTASFRIVWIDPISKEETDIFPEFTTDIKQKEPDFSSINSTIDLIGINNVKVKINNLFYSRPSTGDGEIIADVNIKDVVSQIRVPGYELIGEPVVRYFQDNLFDVEFNMKGEPNKHGILRGTIVLKFSLEATNPINGVVSGARRANIQFPVNKRISNSVFEFDIIEPYTIKNESILSRVFSEYRYQKTKDLDQLISSLDEETSSFVNNVIWMTNSFQEFARDAILNGYDSDLDKIEKIYELHLLKKSLEFEDIIIQILDSDSTKPHILYLLFGNIDGTTKFIETTNTFTLEMLQKDQILNSIVNDLSNGRFSNIIQLIETELKENRLFPLNHN